MAQAGTAKYEAKTPHPMSVFVSGSFLPNGASAVATTYGANHWTVARQSAGVFRVTFSRKVAQFISVVVGLTTDQTTADQQLHVGNYTLPTASADGYFDITYRLAAVATDITASAALRRINFIAELAESDVPGNGV
jgi:hypothetical protein